MQYKCMESFYLQIFVIFLLCRIIGSENYLLEISGAAAWNAN